MYPKNDENEGPFSQLAKYSSYSELQAHYSKLQPYELDPIQKKKIRSQIEKCENLIIVLRRKAFLDNGRYQTAKIHLRDSISLLRKIKNTHQYLETAQQIIKAIDYWHAAEFGNRLRMTRYDPPRSMWR